MIAQFYCHILLIIRSSKWLTDIQFIFSLFCFEIWTHFLWNLKVTVLKIRFPISLHVKSAKIKIFITFLSRIIGLQKFVESLLDQYESMYSISLISHRYFCSDGTTLIIPENSIFVLIICSMDQLMCLAD